MARKHDRVLEVDGAVGQLVGEIARQLAADDDLIPGFGRVVRDRCAHGQTLDR